jgi:hypothetical protein
MYEKYDVFTRPIVEILEDITFSIIKLQKGLKEDISSGLINICWEILECRLTTTNRISMQENQKSNRKQKT